ncbi:hypothetical protein TL10_11915 [Mycolicibacterium llatzerense]|uniref:Uncharacterized protein n=1 Tax=Mycolicibacterium llatzerense TaxID=280871 RepID=A0A0D1JW15_9MYCO|nr:hypothetical protein TL10_11915 [Mycolicibacterium llatzerense]
MPLRRVDPRNLEHQTRPLANISRRPARRRSRRKPERPPAPPRPPQRVGQANRNRLPRRARRLPPPSTSPASASPVSSSPACRACPDFLAYRPFHTCPVCPLRAASAQAAVRQVPRHRRRPPRPPPNRSRPRRRPPSTWGV